MGEGGTLENNTKKCGSRRGINVHKYKYAPNRTTTITTTTRNTSKQNPADGSISVWGESRVVCAKVA